MRQSLWYSDAHRDFQQLWLILVDILQARGLENIAKILENRAEVAQNHDARKAVSPTLSVLK